MGTEQIISAETDSRGQPSAACGTLATIRQPYVPSWSAILRWIFSVVLPLERWWPIDLASEVTF